MYQFKVVMLWHFTLPLLASSISDIHFKLERIHLSLVVLKECFPVNNLCRDFINQTGEG